MILSTLGLLSLLSSCWCLTTLVSLFPRDFVGDVVLRNGASNSSSSLVGGFVGSAPRACRDGAAPGTAFDGRSFAWLDAPTNWSTLTSSAELVVVSLWMRRAAPITKVEIVERERDIFVAPGLRLSLWSNGSLSLYGLQDRTPLLLATSARQIAVDTWVRLSLTISKSGSIAVTVQCSSVISTTIDGAAKNIFSVMPSLVFVGGSFLNQRPLFVGCFCDFSIAVELGDVDPTNCSSTMPADDASKQQYYQTQAVDRAFVVRSETAPTIVELELSDDDRTVATPTVRNVRQQRRRTRHIV